MKKKKKKKKPLDKHYLKKMWAEDVFENRKKKEKDSNFTQLKDTEQPVSRRLGHSSAKPNL